MIRFFLTLLALLTGIAAQTTVVDARASGAAGAEVAAQLADSGTLAPAVETRAAGLAASPQQASQAEPRHFLFRPVNAPSVLAGIDRARE